MKASDASARRQSSRTIAATVVSTTLTLRATSVAVLVNNDCRPAMSLDMRDCTSPVRAVAKKASESDCKCS